MELIETTDEVDEVGGELGGATGGCHGSIGHRPRVESGPAVDDRPTKRPAKVGDNCGCRCRLKTDPPRRGVLRMEEPHLFERRGRLLARRNQWISIPDASGVDDNGFWRAPRDRQETASRRSRHPKP
jgi:hypothetical protein